MELAVISTLAGAVVSLLSSFLVQGLAQEAGEKMGEKAGEDAWLKVKSIYETVKNKFSSKPETDKVMNAFEEAPADSDTQAVVRFHLKKIMESDEEFTRDVTNQLQQASEAGADTMFQTTIMGDVNKLVQMGNVYGDVNI